ncbi:hypothetical protein NHX12_028081 [Muraenolepis orangiensis]|uniref:Dymeclin n=1 Tax=Muraenolepis orangiensis TaxID=630683 RepID=A0A9Q0EGX1_9TELE|nr:hypothetical protein NHX12_028081 [Muraenolepis orangiensis]
MFRLVAGSLGLDPRYPANRKGSGDDPMLMREEKGKFPELKFKYVEEDQPEDFFIPYVWSLVFNSGVGLSWSPQGVELFSMDSG